MSGIARVLHLQGQMVTGSDLQETGLLNDLQEEGITIYYGHREENVVQAGLPDEVIISSAIPDDNCELAAACRLNIPISKRAEVISRWMNKQRGIAVAGTHGKTTTTAMVASILAGGGLDPSIMLGGIYPPLGGNCRLGQGDFFLSEADESDGSFLFMEPEFMVINNIEQDHMEFFQSEKRLYAIFAQFIYKLKDGGILFLNGDDPGIKKMMQAAGINSPEIITYGPGKKNDFYYIPVDYEGRGIKAEIYRKGQLLGELKLAIPGEHNLANALAAIAIGNSIGVPFPVMAETLAEFQGVERRFHIHANKSGITIVDDYGHHPTEIKATLKAARRNGAETIITVFQPHRYTRVQFLFQDFLDAFSESDEVIVTDIYPAGEKPIPGISGRRLAGSLHHDEVRYLPDFKEIEDYLWAKLKPGDLVITMGAGDVWKIGKSMAVKLLEMPQTFGLEAKTGVRS